MKKINPSYINSGTIDPNTHWIWGRCSLIILNANNLRVFQELLFTSKPLSFSFSSNGNLLVCIAGSISIYHPDNSRTLFQPPQYIEYSRTETSATSVDFLTVLDEDNEHIVSIGNTLQIFEIKKREPLEIYSAPIIPQTNIRYLSEFKKTVVQYIKTQGNVIEASWRKNMRMDSPALLLIRDTTCTTLWYDNPSSIQSNEYSLFCSTGIYVPEKNGVVEWIYYHHNIHSSYSPNPIPCDQTTSNGFHNLSSCERLLPQIDVPRSYPPDYCVQFNGETITILIIRFTPHGTPMIDISDPLEIPSTYNKTFPFLNFNGFIPVCTESIRASAAPTTISICTRSKGMCSLFSIKSYNASIPNVIVENVPMVIAGHTSPATKIIVHPTKQYILSISNNEALLWLIGGVQQYMGAFLKLVSTLEPIKHYCFYNNYLIGCNGKKCSFFKMNGSSPVEKTFDFEAPLEVSCIAVSGKSILLGSIKGIFVYTFDDTMQLKNTIRVNNVLHICGINSTIFIGTSEGNFMCNMKRPVPLPMNVEGKIYAHHQLRICALNKGLVSVYQREGSDSFEFEASLGDASSETTVCGSQKSGYISIAIGRGNNLEWWTPCTFPNLRLYSNSYELLDSIHFSEKIGALGSTDNGTTVVATGNKIVVFSKWEQQLQRVTRCIEPQQSYPLYHPRCLLQLMYLGCTEQVNVILKVYLDFLQKKVPFPLTYNDIYEMYVNDPPSENILSDIIKELHITRDETLTISEQGSVAGICEVIVALKNVGGLDNCGKRYFVSHKLDSIIGKIIGKLMRPIDSVWAYHSDAKPTLIQELQKMKLDLNMILDKGVGYWLSDKPDSLKEVLSFAAKIEYVKKKDPNDVVIIYVLLGRISALAALFRLNKEKKIADFLQRDFTNEKNRIAAVKNAFVLVSQHKYHLAIAFFLIGGSPFDAVKVALNKVESIELAFLISTVHNVNSEQQIRELILPMSKESKCVVGTFFCYIYLKEHYKAIMELMEMKEEPCLLYLLEYFKTNALYKKTYRIDELPYTSSDLMRRNLHLYLRNRCAPLAYHLLEAQTKQSSQKPVETPQQQQDDWFDDFMSGSSITETEEVKEMEINIDQCFPNLQLDFLPTSMNSVAAVTVEHLIHRYVTKAHEYQKYEKLSEFVLKRATPFLETFGYEKEESIRILYRICKLTDSIEVLYTSTCFTKTQNVAIIKTIQDSPFVSSFVDQASLNSIKRAPDTKPLPPLPKNQVPYSSKFAPLRKSSIKKITIWFT
ncbi:RAVE complex protein Rav1 C-terminal domain-containing protein [Entamoeba marina]